MKEQEMVKKELFIIKPHSMVDLITNSSSELFVCQTDKTLETVRELLIDMLNLHNKIHESNLKFEDCFEEPYYITEDNFDRYFEEYVMEWGITMGAYNMKTIFDFKGQTSYKYPYSEYIDHNRRINDMVEKEYQNYLQDWKEKNYEGLRKNLIGSIIIESTSDNTIPYELFDIIENSFNASRHHLG